MTTEGKGTKRVRKERAERQTEILETATRVLINEGHAALTLSRVAREVGIRLSTVQHYFESREALLSALLDYRIGRYGESFERVKAEAEGNPEELARGMIAFLLLDNTNSETCRFFTQLWALGFQSEDVRLQLFHLYDAHRRELAEIVANVRPDLKPVECMQRAAMISSMIEGSLLHIGAGLPLGPDLVDLREQIEDHLMCLIKS